ncbi:MAG: hypothetical protein HY696_02615 [Deltaproteobacteria bacterium]|nr:hypothetical protein [Deltaproteobacteria bacterium]
MVEKIDRPAPVAPWTIKASGSAQDRGGGQGFAHEEEQSSPGTPEGWQKFHARQESRRLMTVPQESIRHIWFRSAVLRRQLAIVEADMELENGHLLRGVQFLLPRLDDYFQFKSYVIGQEVPPFMVVHGPLVEVSVPAESRRSTATTTHATPLASAPPQRWWSLWDDESQRIRPLAIGLIAVGLLAVIVTILALL